MFAHVFAVVPSEGAVEVDVADGPGYGLVDQQPHGLWGFAAQNASCPEVGEGRPLRAKCAHCCADLNAADIFVVRAAATEIGGGVLEPDERIDIKFLSQNCERGAYHFDGYRR